MRASIWALDSLVNQWVPKIEILILYGYIIVLAQNITAPTTVKVLAFVLYLYLYPFLAIYYFFIIESFVFPCNKIKTRDMG